ncbi:MAG: hypothetical protein ABIJ45_14330, partial [Candidatus Zixiibacteriota bacterium]
MKKITILIICTMMIAGCAPKKFIGKISQECAPSNLTVKSNDRTLFLKWNTNCDKGTLISGYYIYLQEKPIDEAILDSLPPKNIKPFNLAAYPGDTDPETAYETMTISNLDNGVEYYLSVRTTFPDRSLTRSSNQVNVICRPEGEFELDFRFSSQRDGFSFAKGATVRADGENNDVYFFSKDGVDFLASPNRLNGFIRKSQFFSLGKTKDIYQYPEVSFDYEPVEKIPAFEGESYIIKTADNRYAKIRIESITGELKQRKIKLKYIYQT